MKSAARTLPAGEYYWRVEAVAEGALAVVTLAWQAQAWALRLALGGAVIAASVPLAGLGRVRRLQGRAV